MSSTPDLDAMPKVMGDDGQFHAVDEEVLVLHLQIRVVGHLFQ